MEKNDSKYLHRTTNINDAVPTLHKTVKGITEMHFALLQ